MPIVTRRSFVGTVGTVVVVAAGAAGVGFEFVRNPRRRPDPTGSSGPAVPNGTPAPLPPASALLAQALTRERELVTRLEHAARAAPALRSRLGVLSADHRAHADALSALLTAAGGTAPTATSSPASSTPASPRSVTPSSQPTTPARAASAAQVLGWEKANAVAAANDCPTAIGPAAAVLASIHACEQTHVAWLG